MPYKYDDEDLPYRLKPQYCSACAKEFSAGEPKFTRGSDSRCADCEETYMSGEGE